MAEENSEEVKKSNSGGKGLLIVLIALVVILLLAVIGGGYFLYSQGVLNQSQTQETVVKEEASSNGKTFKVDLNDLVLNITDSRGREKLLKLSFTLQSTEEKIEALVEEYRAEIIDVVISQISARSAEELLTVGGKNLLRDELVEDINRILNEVTASNSEVKRNSIQKVLFTSFVMK